MMYTLLNTRPQHQAAGLTNLIVADGGQVLSCPLMEIVWLQPAAQTLDKLSDNPVYDKAIFTSANAVFGWQQLINYNNTSQIGFLQGIAIGKATQQKAQQSGITLQCLSAEKFDSEHLLQHPSMQQLSGQRILLITGENGRDLLPNTLRERGAEVVEVFVYRRQAKAFCQQQWQEFLQSPHPILLISSLQAWQQLLEDLKRFYQTSELFSEVIRQQIWQAIDCVLVYSERIAQQIRDSGYSGDLQVVPTQSDQGVLSALQALSA